MKNHTTFAAVTLIVLAVISSCSPIIYSPIDDVAPVLDKQGEGEVGMSMSIPNDFASIFSSGGNPSVQLAAAYSPLSNIGVFGKYNGEIAIDNKIRSGTLGVGFYQYFEERFLFQAYVIGGRERSQLANLDLDATRYALDFNRNSLGIQPGIIYINGIVELGLTCTYKQNWYRNIVLEDIGNPINPIVIPDQQQFLEPALSLSLIGGPLKLNIKYGQSFLVDDNIFEDNPNAYFSFGVNYVFQQLEKSN